MNLKRWLPVARGDAWPLTCINADAERWLPVGSGCRRAGYLRDAQQRADMGQRPEEPFLDPVRRVVRDARLAGCDPVEAMVEAGLLTDDDAAMRDANPVLYERPDVDG